MYVCISADMFVCAYMPTCVSVNPLLRRTKRLKALKQNGTIEKNE